jgi:alpha-L-rhamnosidase
MKHFWPTAMSMHLFSWIRSSAVGRTREVRVGKNHGVESSARPRVLSKLWLGCLALITLGFPVSAQVTVTELRTEYLTDPQGLDVTAPRFSWRLESAQRGQVQTAWQVLVATSTNLLHSGTGDVWDSGRVSGSNTAHIVYGGRPLRSGEALFWKVRAWDGAEGVSPWSAPASWSMALLERADWKGDWIAHRDQEPLHTRRDTLHLPPARHFRTLFAADRPVRRATLHFTALGLAEFHINGVRVGDAWFEPGWADYHQRVHTRTHDVTGLLRPGANALGAILADGWYSGYVGYGLLVGYGPHQTGRDFYGKTPAFLAQLEIEYADGSRARVITDRTWQVSADGPIREADLIMGESYDARRHRPDWSRPGGATDWSWHSVVLAADNPNVRAPFHDTLGVRDVDLGFRPPPKFQSYAAPPIRVTEELPVRAITEPAPGTHIFDFGQNFAGAVRLRVRGPAGTRVQLRFGEMLHADGRLMTENLRRARATDTYILRGGEGEEIWQPRFTYHGFRYVEVTGLPGRPRNQTLTGLVLHNATTLTSEFACSDEVLTRFWKNTVWTQRANFIEIPTDCPQRDERLGWMGDAQIYVRTATYNADVASFFTKWMDDVVEAQRDFGAYPDYAPYPMAHGAPGQTWGTAWTDAGILCPRTVWQVYGDTRILERLWPSMTRFMTWRHQRAPDFRGRSDGNTWGDWLNVQEPTPLEYVDAAYFAWDCHVMAEMAAALGRTEEAARYEDWFQQATRQFRADYLNADGTLRVATQTAHALVLAFGLLPESDLPRVAQALADRIVSNGHRMATGFLGTHPLLPVLTRFGHHDLAVRLFQSRNYPSWGYPVINGATTVWERWDSFTKEFGFNGAGGDQNASMNSFSHYAFGAAMEWAFRHLAGIDTKEPGFGRILIAPLPPQPDSNPDVTPIHWVQARYHSIRGPIHTAWRLRGDRYSLDIALPANTTATVLLPPGADPKTLQESGRSLDGHPHVQVLGMTGDRLGLQVVSGTYRFAVRL